MGGSFCGKEQQCIFILLEKYKISNNLSLVHSREWDGLEIAAVPQFDGERRRHLWQHPAASAGTGHRS